MRTDRLAQAISFERLFKTRQGQRDKFLSRIFGIFSEEIVRIWSRCEQAPYQDLGRPTVRLSGEPRGKTLDFTFRSRKDGRLFIGEMKCELEFENYRYLALIDHSQLDHHKGDAFERFLKLGRNPKAYAVLTHGQRISPSGTILVWGCVTPEGRKDVKRTTGKIDVLSVEDVIGDLLAWNPSEYHEFVASQAQWCRELFGALAGRAPVTTGEAQL